MDNYFEQEIMALERELRQLKTAQQKSAGQVPTIYKSLSFNVLLYLNSSQTAAHGSATFKVTTTSNCLIIPTLAKYYDDISLAESIPLKTRYMMIVTIGKLARNTYLITLSARGTEGLDSDVTTLRNGGSVVLDNTLTVQSTDEFTLEQTS